MIDPGHVESLLKFLGIQRKHWQVAMEQSVLASVRAFHFLHTVRFGGRSDAMRTAFDPENNESEQDDCAENEVPKRKVHNNHVRSAKDNADSDSSTCYEAVTKQPRTISSTPHQPLTTQGVTTEADEDGSPCTSAPGRWQDRLIAQARHTAAQHRPELRRGQLASSAPPRGVE
jgi:hypothetical protein